MLVPMEYDLARLGWREFEHLAQTIAMKVLGPGISVFGKGPDGGREATFTGPVNFPSPPADAWDGYGVLQAKYKERLTDNDNPWFLSELGKEIKVWLDEDSARRKHGTLPDYLIVVTNVTLSSTAGTGGIDRANKFLQEKAAELGLKVGGFGTPSKLQLISTCTQMFGARSAD
jgi:hypothetical protein